MICSNCKEELNFSKKVLSKMKNCPFCGSELKQESSKEDISVSKAIQSVIDDYGIEIFNGENESRLKKILMGWPETISLERDCLLMLLIKHIPQRLCESLDLPKKERLPVVLQSVECLVNEFKFSQEVALEHVKLFSDALGLDSSIKIKEDIPTEFVDPRDGEKYRLVKIGKQLWFAENFRHVCDGSCIYKDQDLNWTKYGCLYTHQSALDNCPEGWRLPSDQDFRQLIREAGNNELSLMKYAKNNAGKDIVECDDLKFSMLPGGMLRHEIFGMHGKYESAGQIGVLWLSSKADCKRGLGYFKTCEFHFDGPYFLAAVKGSHLDQPKDGRDPQNYYSVRYVKDI